MILIRTHLEFDDDPMENWVGRWIRKLACDVFLDESLDFLVCVHSDYGRAFNPQLHVHMWSTAEEFAVICYLLCL